MKWILEHITDLVYLVSIVCLFLTYAIGSRIKKKHKGTNTIDSEVSEDTNENSNFLIKCIEYISQAEKLFKNTTQAGAYKKDSVLKSMQILLGTCGVEFDTEYWSNKIDELVTTMKEVR